MINYVLNKVVVDMHKCCPIQTIDYTIMNKLGCYEIMRLG